MLCGRDLSKHDEVEHHQFVMPPAQQEPVAAKNSELLARLRGRASMVLGAYPYLANDWRFGSLISDLASATDGSAGLQEEPPSPSVEAHPEPRKEART